MFDLIDGISCENQWVRWLPPFLQQHLTGRPNLQAIVANTGWLVFDRLFRMLIGFAINLWIARHFGPSLFGLLNYAISFTAIIGAMASLGLESIGVRHLIRDKTSKDRLLGTALGMRVLSGLLVVLAALSASYFISTKEPRAIGLIIWIALGYVAQSLDVVDYWFQANVSSRYSVISRNCSFLVVSALKIAALIVGLPIVAFAILSTIDVALSGASLVIAYRLSGGHPRFWAFDKILALQLLKDGWPLTLSGLVIVVYMKVDQVLLGNMMGPSFVGVYAAAARLMEMWYFVPAALVVSLLPSILHAKAQNPSVYQTRLQQLYDLMAILSIGIATAVTLVSRQLVSILFGEEYRDAAAVVTIYIWSGIPTFLGMASSQYLLAENLNRISLYRTSIGMILNVVLNLLFIPKFGITGSAVATLISYTVATFGVVFFKESRKQTVLMLKSLLVFRGLTNIFVR